MAEKIDIFYDSKDGTSQIHAIQWLPEEREPKAILQIVHGMQEYANRYDALARYIADRGFIVVAEDHLGHGSSASSDSELSYFTLEDPETVIIEDVHTLHKMIHAEYPGLPIFMYGFSMGSFMARKYLSMYGEGLDGAIIAGSGWKDEAVLRSGLFAADVIKRFHGDHYRSPFLAKAAFGTYLKRIPDAKTDCDWLSTDENVVNAYHHDTLCGIPFSVNGYTTLFKLLLYVQDPKNAKRVPPTLPVYFMSGWEDPVGDYGAGVQKAAKLYIENGVKNVSIKLYDDMRHEIHNEKRKHIVYLDILEWIESQL